MEVFIKQLLNTSTSEYSLEIEGQTRYYAYIRSRKGRQFIDIVSLRGVQPYVFHEIKIISKSKYQINIPKKEPIICERGTKKEGGYQLLHGDDRYKMIGQKNGSASIFKNGQKIGFYSNTTIVNFISGNEYKLTIDDDCDFNILLSLALIWSSRNASNGLFNFF